MVSSPSDATKAPDAKLYEEIKKFIPPTAVWSILFAAIAWAINAYVPPGYELLSYGLWIILAVAARYLGVRGQDVIAVASTAGIDITPPPGVAFSDTPIARNLKVVTPVDPGAVGRTLL